MNRLLIKIDYQKIVGFTLTLLSIWMSRTVFWGIINQNSTRVVYCLCILIGAFLLSIRVDRIKKAFTEAAVPVFLFLANMLICLSEMNQSNMNAVLGYIIMLLCAAMTVVLVRMDLFAKYYIYILFVYCIISLPCVLIANINPDLARIMCQNGYNWTTPYGYNPLYTWGMNGTISVRNSGPFWEPGAFQGFIWIAMLFLLFNADEKKIKKRKEIFLVLFVTLLTTRSTTGYALLIVAFIFLHGRILELLGIERMSSRVMAAVIIALVGLAMLNSSSVITDKIGNTENISTQMRAADIILGSRLVIKAGPFGLGETETRNALRLGLGLYKDDSAGLIQIAYTFGWLMGVYYIAALLQLPKRLLGTDYWLEKIGIFIIVLVLHLTEGLWSLPLFWILLFGKKES